MGKMHFIHSRRGVVKMSFVAAFAGIIAVGLIIVGIHFSNVFFLSLMGEQLSYMADDIASRVDADAHSSIALAKDVESLAYKKVSDVLETEQEIKKGVKSIYTLRVKDGEVRFIVVPPADLNNDGKIEGDLEARQAVGTPYGQPADPEMLGAAVFGKTTPGVKITEDRWGAWLSGCAPLVTKSGNVDAALCVDQDAKPIIAHMYKMDIVVVVGVILVCLMAATAIVNFFGVKMEKARRMSAERGRTTILNLFQVVFESVPSVAMHVLDRKGRISFWNKVSEQLFGVKREEVIGKNVATFLADAGQASELQGWIDKTWHEKRPSMPREWLVRKKDGGLVKTIYQLVPVIYEDEVFGIVCIGVQKTHVG